MKGENQSRKSLEVLLQAIERRRNRQIHELPHSFFPNSHIKGPSRNDKIQDLTSKFVRKRINPANRNRLGIHFLILFSSLSRYLEAIATKKMKTFHIFKAIKYLKVYLYAPIPIAKIRIGAKKLMELPNSAKSPSAKTR